MNKILFVVSCLLIASINVMAQKSAGEIGISSGIVDNSEKSTFNNGKGDVSLYTGTAQFIVPIFELKSRDLSDPISLNYSSSGARVSDLAGPVGLGWNLNAGGYIKREVKGLPDELPNKGYFSHTSIVQKQVKMMTKNEKIDIINKAMDEDYDTHPDVFHYSFGKHIGKFVFDENLEPVFIPYKNFLFEKYIENNKISGFKITTDDGSVYSFGYNSDAIEETKISTLSVPVDYKQGAINQPLVPVIDLSKASEKVSTNDYYNTGWFLDNVSSPRGDYIRYAYTRSYSVNVEKPNVFKYELLTKIKSEDGIIGDSWGSIYYYGPIYKLVRSSEPLLKNYNLYSTMVEEHARHEAPWYPPGHSEPAGGKEFAAVLDDLKNIGDDDTEVREPSSIFLSQNRIEKNNVYLSSIVTSLGNSVSLEYSSDYVEVFGKARVDRIYLKNKYGKIVSDKVLRYHFVTSNTTKDDIAYYNRDPLSYLEAEVFRTCDYFNTSLFDTEGNYQGEPLAASKAHNYFDNLSVSNKAIFEKYVDEGLKEYNYQRLFLRQVFDKNFESGKTINHYEFIYKGKEDLPRRTSVRSGKYGYWLGGKGYDYKNMFFIDEGVHMGQHGYAKGQLEKVKLPSGGFYKFGYGRPDVKDWHDVVETIWKLDMNENILGVKKVEYQLPHTRNVPSSNTVLNHYNVPDKRKCFFKLSASYGLNQHTSSLINGSPVAYEKVIVRNYLDKNCLIDNGHEEFVFTWQENEVLNHSDLLDKVYYYPVVTKYLIGWLQFYSSCWSSSDYIDWCQAEYSEEFKDANSLYPFVNSPDLDYVNGKLKTHSVFNKRGDKVKETVTEYEFVQNELVQGVNGFKYFYSKNERYVGMDLCSDRKRPVYNKPTIDQYRVAPYYHIGGLIQVKKKTESNYEPETMIQNQVTSEYFYNENNRIKEVRTKLSDQEEQIVNYNYPVDIIDESGVISNSSDGSVDAIQYMLDNYIIGSPVETINKTNRSGKVIINGASLNLYRVEKNKLLLSESYKFISNNINADYTPMRYYSVSTPDGYHKSLSLDENLQKVISYDSYDSFGNLRVYHEKDNIYHSILYGYDNTMPIAKIENLKNIATSNAVVERSLDIGISALVNSPIGVISSGVNIGEDGYVTLNFNSISSPAGGISNMEVYFESTDGQNPNKSIVLDSNNLHKSLYLKKGTYNIRYEKGEYVGAFGEITFKQLLASEKVHYQGFENFGGATYINGYSKSGEYALKGEYRVNSGSLSPGNYLVEYWVSSDGKQWVRNERNVSVSSSSDDIVVGASNKFVDEVRVLPVNSKMTTFSYIPLVGITSETDINGYTNYSTYDDFGRIISKANNWKEIIEFKEYHQTTYVANLETSASYLNFICDGASKNIRLTTNVNWTATVSDDWFSLSQYSGVNSADIAITCQQNLASQSREGKVTIMGEGVQRDVIIKQEGATSPYLQVSSLDIGDIYGMGSGFNITSNTDWTISVSYRAIPNPTSFINVSALSGNGSKYISVRSMGAPEPGEGTLKIQGAGETIYVNFTISN